ncbi:hypothetical protein [Pseudomonas sp. PS01303]|uniref:hypothetical protein n=1 Tax=Pseudomonas sp. PS01303 TaxID=2991439 RepID=UPI00249B1FD8|nr:hypothetical protein [Pseudomonas sp. PS01303]
MSYPIVTDYKGFEIHENNPSDAGDHFQGFYADGRQFTGLCKSRSEVEHLIDASRAYIGRAGE